ncbi:hypothetical protein SpCBS45565_g08288 [Spizellomyces sp. 'palustris']|nr:hypothetical protein SpCBS45565_g08288 [Spizellomyces sp. 'palustris']
MSSTLQPSLQLYRSIRRLHKRLPPALRAVGNGYVKDEFRRHSNADPAFVPGFIQEWARYRDMLQRQVSESPFEPNTSRGLGRKLEEQELNALNDQQLGQLHALREATRGKLTDSQ